jgi:EcoRII C terminal
MVTIRRGLLSDHFSGIGAKTLAAVDADTGKSNQHEVTGSRTLLEIFGTRERRKKSSEGGDTRFVAKFIWLGGEQEAITEEGRVSWYDSRSKVPTRSAEWRLYYQDNAVTELMNAGDTLFVALTTDDKLLFVVTPSDSTIKNQLTWLFGLPEKLGPEFSSQHIENDENAEIDFAARYILDELGVEFEEREADRLDAILAPLGLGFPSTMRMSALARKSLPEVDPLTSPDLVLEREEQLFRRLERRIVSDRLQKGFVDGSGADVDGFLSFSLSVQNRRKSRMGWSLEHHLQAIFESHQLTFAKGTVTENKARPDFLFPGAAEYADPSFPAGQLVMLGAKSSCKDRWRQVLAEAARIPRKHLLTLEPGISENQTSQMRAHDMQLILPEPIHASYTAAQRSWLMSLSDFVTFAKSQQV